MIPYLSDGSFLIIAFRPDSNGIRPRSNGPPEGLLSGPVQPVLIGWGTVQQLKALSKASRTPPPMALAFSEIVMQCRTSALGSTSPSLSPLVTAVSFAMSPRTTPFKPARTTSAVHVSDDFALLDDVPDGTDPMKNAADGSLDHPFRRMASDFPGDARVGSRPAGGNHPAHVMAPLSFDDGVHVLPRFESGVRGRRPGRPPPCGSRYSFWPEWRRQSQSGFTLATDSHLGSIRNGDFPLLPGLGKIIRIPYQNGFHPFDRFSPRPDGFTEGTPPV